MGATASKKATGQITSTSQNPSNASTASQLSDHPTADTDSQAPHHKPPPDLDVTDDIANNQLQSLPSDHSSQQQQTHAELLQEQLDQPPENDADSVRDETPGIKKVEVLQVNNPEDYEDETNQTGLSHYEMKIQEKFFSVPDRPRGRAYNAAAQADKDKRQAKADRKADRASRRKSKSKNKNQPPTEPPAPNTVAWAIENTKKSGILNLSKMDLSEMPGEVFDSMPGTARIINIAFNRFTVLDNRICDYVLVQRLIANGNFITEIPPTISHMTDLKKLDLARNKLTSLPDAFEAMRYLEHVDLSENELTELPPSFSALNLTALNLSRNKFVIAPAEIASMEWLMDLDMSNNSIANIPSAYCNMQQLIALNLDNNKVSDFPDDVLAQCNELVTLRLRANPLTIATLEAKESYKIFDMRRKAKLKRQIDSGTISEADLIPTDN